MDKKKEETLYQVRVYTFNGGRAIKPEDYSASKHFTEEQYEKIAASLQKVFSK